MYKDGVWTAKHIEPTDKQIEAERKRVFSPFEKAVQNLFLSGKDAVEMLSLISDLKIDHQRVIVKKALNDLVSTCGYSTADLIELADTLQVVGMDNRGWIDPIIYEVTGEK